MYKTEEADAEKCGEVCRRCAKKIPVGGYIYGDITTLYKRQLKIEKKYYRPCKSLFVTGHVRRVSAFWRNICRITEILMKLPKSLTKLMPSFRIWKTSSTVNAKCFARQVDGKSLWP